MIKQYLRLTLAALALASAIGCAGPGADEPPPSGAAAQGTEVPAGGTARFSLFYPVQVGGPIAELVEELAARFNGEVSGAEVTAEFCGSYDETLDRLTAAIQAGEPPELVILDTPNLLTLIAMDAVEPLDSYILADGGYDYINDFFPSFMLDSVYDGSIYSIPFQRSALLMFYNRDHFREAGLDPERPPETWMELADYAAKLTRRTGGDVERWGILIPEGVYNFAPLVISCGENGENLMTPDGRTARFFTPESVEALQYLIDLSAVHGATPAGAIPMETTPGEFIAGRASIVYLSSGNLANIHASVDFDYGAAVLPRARRNASIAGGGNIHMIKGTPAKSREAAWKFIRWMTQPERQAQWNVDTGYIASRRSAFETTIMDNYYEAVPQARAAYNQLDTCYSGFCVYEAVVLNEILQGNTEAALTGEVSAVEALAEAQRQADEVLAPFQ